MPKRTTIVGIRLRCEACGKVFVIGTDGIEAAKKRVENHMSKKGCMMDVRPVDTKFSRPKGLTYTGGGDRVPDVVYDGKDWDKFWNEVMNTSRGFVVIMSPKLELTEV